MAVTVGAIIGISIGFGCLLVLCVGRKSWKERRLVQNAENSNRENVYKLIDFWAKPEVRCDCATLHPEVTCDCAPPELHHLHRQMTRENLARYIGGGDTGVQARWENDGCPKRCLQGGLGSYCQWDADRGAPADPPAEVHHYDEALFLRRHRTTTTTAAALQRCICTSGKCRQKFVAVNDDDDDDGHQHNNGAEEIDDLPTVLPTVPRNSSTTTPTKSETRTETSNSPQRTSPEQPAS